jgi:hypothetical protein
MAAGIFDRSGSQETLWGAVEKLMKTSYRHGKLFITVPCEKQADKLLRLSRRQLKMVVGILTGRVPVRKHLHTIDLFDGDPTCRFCGKETETVQYIICCCEALARQRYNVFGSREDVPTDIYIP